MLMEHPKAARIRTGKNLTITYSEFIGSDNQTEVKELYEKVLQCVSNLPNKITKYLFGSIQCVNNSYFLISEVHHQQFKYSFYKKLHG